MFGFKTVSRLSESCFLGGHDSESRATEGGHDSESRVTEKHPATRFVWSMAIVASLWCHADDCAGQFNPVPVPDMRGEISRSETLSLPRGGKPTAGIRVFVSLPPYPTPETMRVVVRIESSGGATTADRTFAVTLAPRGHSLPASGVVGRFELTLAQNSREIEGVFYLPKTSYGSDYQVSVAEDGRAIDGFEGGIAFANRDANWTEQVIVEEKTPRFLIVARSWLPPPEAALAEMLGQHRTYLTADLADDWRAYAPFDFVVLPTSTWNDADTGSITSLRRWVRCGGNVLLTDLSPADPLPDSARPSRGGRYETALRYWRASLEDVAISDPLVPDYGRQNRYANLQQWLIKLDSGTGTHARNLVPFEGPLEPIVRRFRERVVEQGELTAASPAPITLESLGAGRIFRTGGSIDRPAGLQVDLGVVQGWEAWRSMRLMRRGVDPILGSQRFAAWLIPGLGQPPVYSFMALLTIFTVLVGPLAYYKTSRGGRTYLMFLIAPALAILTTAAMLLYGVVADGFQTHVRVRQITWLDGQSGHAATRSRSTYFAGIRPTGGLTFDAAADLTMLPDNDGRPWWERQNERAGPPRVLEISGDELRLDGNFLPSRQQRQFITMTPRDDFGVVQLSVQKDTAATFRHRLPVVLRELIACDWDDGLHHGSNVSPGDEVILKPMTQKESGELLGDLYTSEWLVSTRIDQNTRPPTIRTNALSDLAVAVSYEFEDSTKPLEGLFEYELQLRMQLSSQLTPGTFVAVADLTDDALAHPDAIPTDSIHFIFGSLGGLESRREFKMASGVTP